MGCKMGRGWDGAGNGWTNGSVCLGMHACHMSFSLLCFLWLACLNEFNRGISGHLVRVHACVYACLGYVVRVLESLELKGQY